MQCQAAELLLALHPAPLPCSGKRYKKLAWQKAEEEALSIYEPFLVQSKNFP